MEILATKVLYVQLGNGTNSVAPSQNHTKSYEIQNLDFDQ